jgi:ATP-binding cassette, subfamily B, bacterial
MTIENTERKKFIQRYLGQRESLPASAKELIKAQLLGNIQLYALIDLDESLKFCENWIVLTEGHFIIIAVRGEESLILKQIKLQRIASVKEVRSLSCTSLTFIESYDLPALAKVYFTHRQKVIMGHIKYYCENQESFLELSKGNSGKGIDADHLYQESVMMPVLDAQNSVTSENTKTLWRLLSYLIPYRKELIQGTLGAIATTLVSLIPAYLSGKLIDDAIRPFQDGNLSFSEARSMGWIMLCCLGVTYILRELFIFIRLNKMSILGEKVAKDLREQLYRHLQTLSMDFFSKKQTGSIISRVSSDTDRIWDFVAFGVVETGIALITLLGLSIVLMILDFQLGLLMSAPVPFMLYCIYQHGEKMKKLFLRAWRKWSNVTAVLSDTIPGIQVVKAFNQEKKEELRFNKRNDEVTEEFNQIHDAWTKFWPLLMASFQTVLLGVWVFALPRLITLNEDDGLSAGTFVSFLLYMTMFQAPIEVLGQVARMLNRALSSAYRIFEVLDTKATITNKEDALLIDEVYGKVEFKNVFFSYDGVRPIIKDLSFCVQSGEMIGLVGSSGGGKSTITKLISRFYDVNSGSILIDGHDIRGIELGSFRRQIGMVLQEPYLFHGSIFDNIAYGVPEATISEVIQAAKVANAHNFIGRLPHGYDTVVGERGHTLSGGERQRISIARAVLANPRILILDEATSSVDTETERKIQDALDKLIVGRTVFAVAHRLSTLRKANRIFVIGQGNIVEEGTHAELLADELGEYSKLHRMQVEMSESFAL